MSDGRLVVQSNNEGVPFVLADPVAPRSARTSARSPTSSWRSIGRPSERDTDVSDPRPIGVFDSGVGGLTVLREILRRSPDESTVYLGDNARAPYGTRTDDEVRAFTGQASTGCVEQDVKAIVVACNTSTAVALADLRRRYDAADPRRGPAGRRGGRPGDPEPARRGDRDAGHGPLARLLQRDQGREPGGRGVRARHARPSCRWSRPAGWPGPRSRRWSASRSRRSSASATRPASSSSRCRRRPGSTRCSSAAPTTRCCGRSSQAVAGDGVAVVDSATATASALAELLAMNGLEAPDGGGPAIHRQLTTGDVDAFHAARRAAVRDGLRGRRDRSSSDSREAVA